VLCFGGGQRKADLSKRPNTAGWYDLTVSFRLMDDGEKWKIGRPAAYWDSARFTGASRPIVAGLRLMTPCGVWSRGLTYNRQTLHLRARRPISRGSAETPTARMQMLVYADVPLHLPRRRRPPRAKTTAHNDPGTGPAGARRSPGGPRAVRTEQARPALSAISGCGAWNKCRRPAA